MMFEAFRRRRCKSAPPAPRGEAYLLLARHNDDDRPLHLGISSEPTMASHGPWYYTLVDRPYATTISTDHDGAHAKLLRALVLDPEPWTEDIQPLVQELLNPPKAENAYREPARRDTRRSHRPLDPDAVDAAVELLLEAGFDSTHERARVVERLAALKVTP